jgi:riboflavin kinase / FMN adenylyltransferase
VWVTSSLTSVLTPTAIALGNFDGIHRGHRQVIQPVLNLEVESAYPTVVTFNPHPQEFFSGQPKSLLTPANEKILHLKSLGVQQLVLLPFDRELADLSPQHFVEEILVRRLQARLISVGVDFRFGCKRAGTAADLQAIAATYGIEVQMIPLYTCAGDRISSSNVRAALQEGDISRANRLLGRSYTLVGQVTTGQQLGRTIGFPTANLEVPPEKFLPKLGVYGVRVQSTVVGDGHQPLPGVMNLGYRPTVNGKSLAIEVHLFDWSGDLYGQTLTVSVEHFLRSESKFNSLDELKAQIQLDCQTARTLLAETSKA